MFNNQLRMTRGKLRSSALFIGHWVLVIGHWSSAAAHADSVVLAPRPDEPGRIVLSGKILDYGGAGLVMETADSGKQTIPGKQVVEVRAEWNAAHRAGDDAWRRRDFTAALKSFQSAADAEPRAWVKRLLRSRVVATLRELQKWDEAVELFLQLVREDPGTPFFDVIPLAWTPITPGGAAEGKARGWLADRSSKIASLCGAALLLSTAARPEALQRLRELALDGDIRVALLAEAQRWRTAAVTAEAAEVSQWEATIDKLPDALRAGPSLVVGRAWGQRNEPERAALRLLRIPILHAEQPTLAAEALWSAGQMLERLGQSSEAAGLYRELVREHAQAIVASSADDRLKELQAPMP